MVLIKEYLVVDQEAEMSSIKEIMDIINEKNTVNDEYERHVKIKGVVLGTAIALFLGCIMMFVEYMLTNSFDFGKPCLIATICGISYLIDGIKDKHIKEIIAGVFCIICGIVCLYFYLLKNLGIF